MSNSSAPKSPAASLSPPPHSYRLRRSRHSPPPLPAASGATSYRRRVTLLQCLLNTNESNGGAAAVAELKHFAEETLFTTHSLEKIILAASRREKPQANRIRRVEVRAAAIEIGQVQKRVHMHWVMKVVHSDLQLNVGLMQGALQRITAENTSWPTPFASVVLLNAQPENYSLKEVFDIPEENI